MSLATDFNSAWAENLRGNRSEFSDFIENFNFEEIQNEVVGEWRWGIISEAVYKCAGEYIKVHWRDATGYSEIDLEDMRVVAFDVSPHRMMVTVYV